jgi:RNA polymerase primary sigma factor
MTYSEQLRNTELGRELPSEIRDVHPTNLHAVGPTIELNDHMPVKPLTYSQKNWLSEIADEKTIGQIETLTTEERIKFAERLAVVYQHLRIKGMGAKDKEIRGTHIVEILSGKTYKEIHEAHKLDHRTTWARVSSIGRSIGQRITRDTIAELLTDTPLMEVAEVKNLAEYRRVRKTQQVHKAKPAPKTRTDTPIEAPKPEPNETSQVLEEPKESPQTTVVPNKTKTNESLRAVALTEEGYLDKLADHTILNRDDEVKLAKRVEKGDLAAKDELILHNQKLVIKLARQYPRDKGMSLTDLVNEGVIGLIRATEKFDWRKGYKFSTYATPWIRQALQRGFANKGNAIRLPIHKHPDAHKLRELEKQFQQENKRDPSFDELIELSGLKEVDVVNIMRAITHQASLNRSVTEDEGGSELESIISGKEQSPEDVVIADEQSMQIHEILGTLTATEAMAVRMRFGLEGLNAASNKEIGEALRVTEDVAEEIINYALSRLEETVQSDGRWQAAFLE